MGDFDFGSDIFGLRRRSTKRKKRKRKILRKKHHKYKHSKKIKRKSNNGSSDNKDFKKMVKVLTSFEPKKFFSTHVLKNMDEKKLEDKLYTGLSFSLVQNKLKTQVKKGRGIVDLAYKKIGIELKLNKRGVRNMLSRLSWQAKNYHKKYKKLLIYVVNDQRASGESNTFVKNEIKREFNDIKSIRKRDYKVIVKGV